MGKERRKVDRQSWLKLESKVFIKRTLFKKEWVSVVPFDFSRYGMGIQTDEQYQLNDEVSLSIKLLMENEEIAVDLIRGVVRYKEKHHSRFNYGVEFCFETSNEKQNLDENLCSIEDSLREFEGCNDTETTDLTSGG